MKRKNRNFINSNDHVNFDGKGLNSVEFYFEEPKPLYKVDFLCLEENTFQDNLQISVTFIYIDILKNCPQEYFESVVINKKYKHTSTSRWIKVPMPPREGDKRLWKIVFTAPQGVQAHLNYCLSDNGY